MVSLDGNHPLAGQDLVFEIETLDARDATELEVFEAQNLVATQLLH
jgi:FKBP-type peptidyl-prolyl cis-trans isomerase SlyD